MKAMRYAEFARLPEGAIFGQWDGRDDQSSLGLFRKGPSYPEDHGGGAGISVADLVDVLDVVPGIPGLAPSFFLFADMLGEGHLFLVYEPADVERLVQLLNAGGVR